MPNLMLLMPSSNRPRLISVTPNAMWACALLGSSSSARSSIACPRSVSPISTSAQPAKPSTSEALGSMATARSASSRAVRSAAAISGTSDRLAPKPLMIERAAPAPVRTRGRSRSPAAIARATSADRLLAPALHRDGADRLAKMRPGVDIFGAPPPHRRKFRLGQRGLQLDDDPPRDLVLQIERVAAVDIVAAGPELVAAFRLDKLDRDPHLRLRAARAAGDDIADAELGADLPGVGRLAHVLERRRARDHEEARHAREQRDDVFGEPVDDQFEPAVLRHVLERQHGDRRPVGDQRRRFAAGSAAGFSLAGPASSSVTSPTKRKPLRGNGAQQRLALAAVADGGPDGIDAAGQRRIRHHPSAPDAGDQVVLADHPVAVLQQVDQQVEHLRFHGHEFAVPPQFAEVSVKYLSGKDKFHRRPRRSGSEKAG